MAATPTVSPAPWSHEISRDDHGPLILIAGWLMMAATLLLLLIRLAIRWPWRELVGRDDVMTIVASLVAIGQTAAAFEAVHYGLGRNEADTSPATWISMEKAVFSGDILFLITSTASRLAVALLLHRLSSSRLMLIAAHAIIGIITAWGVASTLAVALRPMIATPWVLNASNLSHLVTAWTGSGIVGVIIEVALVVFPICLVWPLQMSIKSKLTVVSGFAFRLAVAILAILRIAAIRAELGNASNASWQLVLPTIYAELEMHFSVVAATIPCMNVFLKSFSTGYLMTTADQVDTTATKGSNSYAMSTVRSRHNRSADKKTGGTQTHVSPLEEADVRLRPGEGVSSSKIVHKNGRGTSEVDAESLTSDGSDKIIVRRTVDVAWGRQNSLGR